MFEIPIIDAQTSCPANVSLEFWNVPDCVQRSGPCPNNCYRVRPITTHCKNVKGTEFQDSPTVTNSSNSIVFGNTIILLLKGKLAGRKKLERKKRPGKNDKQCALETIGALNTKNVEKD